jgi:hypothetical protein
VRRCTLISSAETVGSSATAAVALLRLCRLFATYRNGMIWFHAAVTFIITSHIA